MYVTRRYIVVEGNNSFKSKEFTILEDAKDYIYSMKNRNKNDGHDEYWRNLDYKIYHVVTQKEEIKY